MTTWSVPPPFSLSACFPFRTPLHWCCDRGWTESASVLIGSGVNVNTTTKVEWRMP